MLARAATVSETAALYKTALFRALNAALASAVAYAVRYERLSAAPVLRA